MPPWAQTLWLRLTGTRENRSTLPPASAILTAVIRPARPPPTMATCALVGAAMLLLLLRRIGADQLLDERRAVGVLLAVGLSLHREVDGDRRAQQGQPDPQPPAQQRRDLLRALAD